MNNINNPEVACIASGSGSDFMRTFAMPVDIHQAISRIKNNQNYSIDASFIESKTKSRYFINVLNYGFLAETVNLSEKLPNIFKRFRYPISFWLKLFTGKQSLFNLKTNMILRISGFPKLNFLRKKLWTFSEKKLFSITCPSLDLKKFLVKTFYWETVLI